MRNKPFVLPVRKMKETSEVHKLGKLKNKFSGKTLFRSALYFLETGDLHIIDDIENKWFFGELFTYAAANRDVNLLPALKKIAGSEKFDESLRQQASEVLEKIEDQVKNYKKAATTPGEAGKAENARYTLSGTRYPQTTEILRLLREKSPEMKRLALFLIGKFKMADMIQEVCECLNVHGIENDAYSVLASFGSTAAKEVDRYYLKTSGNINSVKILLRLMPEIHSPADMSFLMERLWSNSRLIKEWSLETLLKTRYKTNDDEQKRLKKNIFEVFGIMSWITTALISLKNNNNDFLSREMHKEYIRWNEYLLGLMILAYGEKAEETDKIIVKEKDEPGIFIPELAGIIYDTVSDPADLKKRLKKLRRFFPAEIPDYKSLLEDIINCDYNLINIWTKACTLRSITEIGEEDLAESVVALLFSPEQILREESARLIARSGSELYRRASERIPEATRKQIDKVVAGEMTEKELVYEKVRFLSSCFNEIKEDELLFLADKLIFARNDHRGIYSQPNNTIMWSFSAEKSEPEIFVNQEDITDPGRIARDIRTTCYYCYVLPLNTVSEFNFLYPESSFGIYRYIDNCEE